MNRHRYDDDFAAWTDGQATLLRARDLGGLDVENLAEEIESLGRSERRELASRLEALVQHLLKWRYRSELRSRSWRTTILTQRDDLQSLLDDSPSLRRTLPERLIRVYPRARVRAMRRPGS